MGTINVGNVPAGWRGVAIGGNLQGAMINGQPIVANQDSPSHGRIHLTNYNPAPAPAPAPVATPAAPVNNNPTYAQTNSPKFIKDTYDPELGYERADSPGDNPYVSSYKPVQETYMNDPSTLSAEELAYREGNIQGLDDRQDSIENAGALMNDYIFRIKENLKADPTTSVGTVGRNDEYDDNYQDDDDDKPYSQYDTSNYY